MSGLHAKLENFAADQAHKRFPEEGSDANRYGFIEGFMMAAKNGVNLQTFLSKRQSAKARKKDQLAP